ncbi:hypothetical protein FQA39_LY00389 [Lamprigera yunnana]|nr:hypothetical protein FQA39_LY00389 [Lamprigera yunnana]
MPKKQATSESDSSILPYIFGAAVGAVAAGVGYYLGKTNRESSTQQTARAHNHSSSTSSSSKHSTYTDNDPDCPICLEDCTPTRILPCKHKFHEPCINKWLTINSVCPKCNRRI